MLHSVMRCSSYYVPALCRIPQAVTACQEKIYKQHNLNYLPFNFNVCWFVCLLDCAYLCDCLNVENLFVFSVTLCQGIIAQPWDNQTLIFLILFKLRGGHLPVQKFMLLILENICFPFLCLYLGLCLFVGQYSFLYLYVPEIVLVVYLLVRACLSVYLFVRLCLFVCLSSEQVAA